MKKLIRIIFVVAILISALITQIEALEVPQILMPKFTISEAYIPSELPPLISIQSIYIDTHDENVLTQLINACNVQQKELNSNLTFQVYVTNSLLKNTILSQCEEIENVKQRYINRLKEIKYANKMNKCMEEYPIATKCWKIMKDWGWSDAVCAGILGNMMAEVGGQTLNIRYDIGSSSYYGLCQWALQYAPSIYGMNLEQQMNYLYNSIQYQFNTYGWLYQAKFNFNSFLTLTDPAAAALAFSKCYERNTPESYRVRMINAQKAYNYFVN